MGLERIALALRGADARHRSRGVRRPRSAVLRAEAVHPERRVAFLELRYQPMLELIDALRAESFSVFIVTGGGTEFVRAVSQDFYAVPPNAVVGTLVNYEFARDARVARSSPVLPR